MTTVRGEIVIDRRPEEVFDFVADEENEPRYNPQMKAVKKLTEGPIGVGTKFRMELEGQEDDPMTLTVTEYVRPRVFGVESHMGSSMDLAGGLTFKPLDSGTRMTWLWNLEPHGALRFFGPVVGAMGRRQERRIWTSLKELLETPPSAPPKRE